MQSRRHDACTQTPSFEYRKEYIEVPLGCYSTFYDIPVCTGPPATINISFNARTTQPPNKRQKYDPSYSPWQSAFEEKSFSTLKGSPSYNVLRKRTRSKKTVKRQDVLDNFEMNLCSKSMLPKSRSKQNEKMNFADSEALAPSPRSKSTITEFENQRNKKVTFVDAITPAPSVRSHTAFSKSENIRNKKVEFEDSIAPGKSVRRNSTLLKSESQRKKKVTFAVPIASTLSIRSHSTFTKSKSNRNQKVEFEDLIASSKSIRSNSTLPKSESQRITKITCAQPKVPVPLSDKDETTENCFHTARKYYDLNFSNEKLFTDTDDDNGTKLYSCERSKLNYNSDSSDHSIVTINLSYEMRKSYYYL